MMCEKYDKGTNFEEVAKPTVVGAFATAAALAMSIAKNSLLKIR